MSQTVLAASDGGFKVPPIEEIFYFDKIGTGTWVTSLKAMILLGLGVVLVIAFMLWTSRNAKMVPSKVQFLGESLYGFVRNGIAVDIMGKKDGLRFAPFLASIFVFVVMLNLFAIIPGAQYPVTSHLMIPAFMALTIYVMYHYLGIKKHGFGKYLRSTMGPPGVPKAIFPLVAVIEMSQAFLVQPFTLALRLFANMFAGHIMLVIFSVATIFMIEQANVVTLLTPFPAAMFVIMTFFELMVAGIQAYVFTVLSAFYLSAAMADEH